MTQTDLFVGAIVRRGHEVLLVRQSPGHPLEGQWTVPWGRVEPGESPVSAALREILEEAGVNAAVRGLLGVQELPTPQQGSVALVYLCEHIDGDLQPRDTETDAARYCSETALDAIESMEPWSEWIVRRVFAGDVSVTPARSENPLQSHGAFL
jgi:8-oxo-dGTP diphosphatase